MAQLMRPMVRLLVLSLCAGLALAACGRKGPLEPPPSAVPNAPQAEAPKASTAVTPIPQQEQKPQQAPAPNQSFPLDILM
jgi:predicted small lipoprotein YifL